jgi:hypothetical protein
MSAYHYEWCARPNSRSGIMVPEENLQKFIDAKSSSGFRSVYGFHPTHAKIIKARGNSKGFREFPCYADQLVIDIDNGDEGKIDAEAKIKAAGLGYRLYFSGGKGYHFIIPCSPLYSYHTPYSHMKYVESLGLETDQSVYRHSSLISLEGRVHPKTKKLKRFLEEVSGKTAEIKIVQPPQFIGNIPEDYNVLSDGFERAAGLVGMEPNIGGRYMDLWRCIKCFSDAGIAPEVAEEIAHAINDSWDNPKEMDEMQRLMEDCYG